MTLIFCRQRASYYYLIIYVLAENCYCLDMWDYMLTIIVVISVFRFRSLWFYFMRFECMLFLLRFWWCISPETFFLEPISVNDSSASWYYVLGCSLIFFDVLYFLYPLMNTGNVVFFLNSPPVQSENKCVFLFCHYC